MSAPAPVAPTKKVVFPSLLTWKDPIATGKVFGGVIAALVVLKSVNLLALFFRLASLGLISSAVAEYVGKLVTGTGFVTRFRPAYTNAGSATLVKFLESFTNAVPALEESVQKLVYAADIENTLKTGVAAYLLYKITSWFSLYTLIFVSTIAAFSLPFVYETYQTEINAAVAEYSKLASAKASEYSKVAKEKAAPYIKQADEKLGPVSKFIKQKYQVRTASTTVNQSAPAAAFEEEKPSATTSGAQVNSVADSVPTGFPSVPETAPLEQKIDVDDLKTDILKNKNADAAVNF